MSIDVSVIIPMYNVEEYLRECLDSVLKQNLENYEVIMVDDGSTDSTGQIADEYAEKYANFTCFHTENGGLSHARNYGVKRATGKYIVFIDSDDYLVEGTYDRMLRVAERTGSDVTLCNVKRINSRKRPWNSSIQRYSYVDYSQTTNAKENPWILYDVTAWNKLIRRDFWEEVNVPFPEGILYEDTPAIRPLLYKAKKIAMLSQTGYFWRNRDGISTSISQNVADDPRKPKDRIYGCKLLREWFQKNGDEQGSLYSEQFCLERDFVAFTNVMDQMNEENVNDVIEQVIDYLKPLDIDTILSSLSKINQQKYRYILNRDIEGLKKLLYFQRNSYETTPIVEKNGRLYMQLPDEIFPDVDKDVTEEIKTSSPRIYIDEVNLKSNNINVCGHAYIWRVNSGKEHPVTFKLYLVDEVNGVRIPLESSSYSTGSLTSQFGLVHDDYTNTDTYYNYDCSGFSVNVNFDSFAIEGIEAGQYILEMEYTHPYFSGKKIVSGISPNLTKSVNGKSIINGDKRIGVSITEADDIVFVYDTNPIVIDKLYFGSPLSIANSKNMPLQIVSMNSGQVISMQEIESAEESDNDIKSLSRKKNYYVWDLEKQCWKPSKMEAKFKWQCIPVKQMEVEESYRVETKGNVDGKSETVYYKGKGLVIQNENDLVYLDGYDNYQLRMRNMEHIATINSVSIDRNKFVLNLSLLDKNNNEQIKQVSLFMNDKLSGNKLVLANGNQGEKYHYSFVIDFEEERINKNMYSDKHSLFLEVTKGEEVEIWPIFGGCKDSSTVEVELLKASINILDDGYACLNTWQSWSERDNTRQKRFFLKEHEVKKYRELPIAEKRIFFESMWGTKYSCNPRAIYEYVDKYYPEFECIWSFEDARTPINGRGKRVRRGSADYWYYRATSKFLINNVNWIADDDLRRPYQRVKRPEQVEVHTMHGTPLKTMGLDVHYTSELEKENFRVKCSNWDYIITQGSFTDSILYRSFEFDKTILKIGYPRTDQMYKTSEKELLQLKEQLGLPKDKKIILYAPTWRVRNRFEFELDLDLMKEKLADDYILLIKIHHLCGGVYDFVVDNKFSYDMTSYDNIENLYLIADLLITDYSSVMFDFAILDKPMIFYTYDYDAYIESLRGIYVDFKEESPGPIVNTSEEVVNAILNIDEELEKASDRIKNFKAKYLTYEQPNSCEAFVQQVLKPEKKAKQKSLSLIERANRKSIRVMKKVGLISATSTNEDGIKNGLVKKDSNVYFLKDGKKQMGWHKEGQDLYYFNKARGYAAHKEWLKNENNLYYFNEDGIMQTGLFTVRGSLFYADDLGRLQTGWNTIDGKKYYFGITYAAEVGWQKHSSGNTFYFDPNGVIQTGFFEVYGKTYYANKGGVVQFGWTNIDNNQYYFFEDGSMATGEQNIDGVQHFFDSNGKLQEK